MGIRLMVRPRSEAGGTHKQREVMLDGEEILIGRDKACHLVLAQTAVSRQHARLSREDGLTFIEDLGSAFGTEVNGKPLPRGEKRLLRNGDVIAVAQFDITFDQVSETRGQSTEGREGKTSFIAKEAVKDAIRGLAAASESPWFRVMNGPLEGEKHPIEEAQELVVGREDDVDIILKDDLVSRRHARFRRDWAGVHVEDLGSRNGIKVNRKRTQRATLADRDEVEVGGIRMLFVDPSAVREEPVVIPEPGTSTEELKSPAADGRGRGINRRALGKSSPELPPEPEPQPEPEPEPASEPFPEEASAAEEEVDPSFDPSELPPDDLPPDLGNESASLPPPRKGAAALLQDRKKLAVAVGSVVFALAAIVIVLLVALGA
jgi:pSer/pThr/pTyr-binding forkhead associated (FHA) protein